MEKLTPKEYMRRYLKVAPLALAVFRAIEAKNVASEPLEKPILDVGCGFGEFAGVFFKSKVEMGLDISWKELVSAKKTNKYKKLVWVDAKELPFGDNYFRTVLSVSVLEHIKDVEDVVSEIYRVLAPGGKLIFTVNSEKIDRMLYWPKRLKSWGFPKLAKKYMRKYHQVFKHETLWSDKKWRNILQKAGFKVKTVREIISPEATSAFDFYLLTAWPSQIAKILFGKRWAFRPGWFREWLVRRYAWLVEQEETEGSNLFVVAVKPGKKIKDL